MAQAISVSDDRGDHKVVFDVYGATRGYPVFLLHGTPGCHSGPIPRSSVLYRLGIKLICYDRPGYGESPRNPGRTIADAAHEVSAIASELGEDEFAVVGRSGGGPHALACAALLPEQVSKVAVLVSIAPSDAADLDWCNGMTRSNVEEFGRAEDCPASLESELNERAKRIQADPEYLLRFLEPELTAADRRIVSDLGIRGLLTDTYAKALRFGAEGWIDDVLAFRQPWGFDLTKIAVPVLLWHGVDDVFSPVAHTQWLATQIPGAVVEVQPDAAHFDAVEVLPRILARLKPRSPLWTSKASERLRVEGAQQPAFSA